jgi:hypothetical protein
VKVPGPVMTLVAMAALAAGILISNEHARKSDIAAGVAGATSNVGQGYPTTSAPASSPSTTPSPATTPSPSPSSVPPDSGFPPEVGYVGENGDGTISVAIAIKGTTAVAYLCDGSNIEAWLRGTAIGGKLTLTGEHSSKLSAVRNGSAISGTLTTAVGTWNFTAQIATGPAGLYRATASLKGVQQRLSWIVKQNGKQTGVLSKADGETEAAPVLNVTNLSAQDGGTTVTAIKITGDAVVGEPTGTS